jgi:hypothetical protein
VNTQSDNKIILNPSYASRWDFFVISDNKVQPAFRVTLTETTTLATKLKVKTKIKGVNVTGSTSNSTDVNT